MMIRKNNTIKNRRETKNSSRIIRFNSAIIDATNKGYKEMYAMVLEKQGDYLKYQEVVKSKPNQNEVLIKITACGLCRTDLHVVDGDLKYPKLPLIPGHQIIGIVEEMGANVKNIRLGQRIGAPWLGRSCGICSLFRLYLGWKF